MSNTIKFEFKPVTCAVCGSEREEELIMVDKYREGSLRFVRCLECGLIYQNPRPTQESLDNFFSSESFVSSKHADQDDNAIVGYYDYLRDEPFRMKLAAYRLRKVEAFFPKKTKLRILKIACGTGSFIKVANDKGHEALGLDGSDFFVKVAREHYQVPMIHSTLEKADLTDKRFDAILFLGALRNMYDLKVVFDKIRTGLAPDGLFIFNYFDVDNILARIQKSNYWLFRPPAIYHFTKQKMQDMLRHFGWEIVAHRQDIQYTNLAKLFGFLGFKSLWWLVEKLHLHYLVIKIPIPNCYWCVARPTTPTD